MEQYLMSEKGALFHNSEIAEKIMKMNYPIHIKMAAYSKMIKGYTHDDWLQAAPKILHKGLIADSQTQTDLSIRCVGQRSFLS